MKKNEFDSNDTLICPVCGKEFNLTDDNKYLIDSDYTCSWKCFSKFVKSHEKEDKERYNKSQLRKQKRKPVEFKKRNYED